MSKWNLEAAMNALGAGGLEIMQTKDIAHGHQLLLKNGTKINIFNTGKAVVQGKHCEEKVQANAILKNQTYSTTHTNAFGSAREPTPPTYGQVARSGTVPPPAKDRVFIVYGHDKRCRDELELLLLRLGLKPVILQNLPATGQTIIEALISNAESDYAIVLLTPDDEGHRIGKGDEKRPRARQNVVLELGLFLARLGRERVAILHKGNVELPSDINGLIYISFNDSVNEAKNKLAATLQQADFFIDIAALSAE